MEELRRKYTVWYEYAVEQLERIYGDGAPLTLEDVETYSYWEGQRDAFQRAVQMLNTQIFAEQTAKAKSGEVL